MAASMACGLAQTLPQLIAFRAIQGLGGAGLYAMPTIMLPEITPTRYFNLMGALMGISMTVAAVCGPFIAVWKCVSLLIGYVFFVIMIQLPERFQIVNGKNPEQAGIYLLAVSGASAFGSIIGVAVSSKKNLSFWTMNVGSAFVLLGTGLLFTMDGSKNVAVKTFGFEVIVGFGLGIIASATTIIIKIEAKVEDAAAAQGLTSQGRLIGGNAGLAVSTIVLNQRITTNLGGEVSPDMLDKLRHSLLTLSEATPAQQAAVQKIFADSFRINMLCCMCIAALAFCVGLLSYQKHPPALVQLVTDGSPAIKGTLAPRQDAFSPGYSTIATSLDVEAQSNMFLSPRSFWSELPSTPIFADQFVYTYRRPAELDDYWNDPNLLTALPLPRTTSAS
ncbi:hypothetical protein KEM56_005235 [Ascosphaera pollenicola]|nr:hypothetical protein KEM56_005235 [Ascosphaera pollenicola]